MTWIEIGAWNLAWHGAAGAADVEPEQRPPPLGEVGCERGRWFAALTGEVVYDCDAWQVPTFDSRAEAVAALSARLGVTLPACPSGTPDV